MFYKAKAEETGNMWDTWLYLYDGMYYLYYLAKSGKQWDNISMATNSPDYPITSGAFDGGYGGGIDRSNWPGDACISILSADGSQLLASTYYGGSGGDGGEGVAVDTQGNVYISGGAYSTDLTVTPDAFQKEHKSDLDAFVAKFSPDDLSQLLYASYLDGTKTDYARCMDAGPNGVFVIGGQTTSSDLPIVNPLRGSLGNVLDTMLAIFR